MISHHYTLCFNEVEKGVYWFHLVCLSVCPSEDRIVSILYLQQYLLDLFHICATYQATSESVLLVMFVSKLRNWNLGKFFKFVTLTLSSFDLGSSMTQYSMLAGVGVGVGGGGGEGGGGYPQNAGVVVVLVGLGMDCGHQAPSHNMNQCWPSFVLPHGLTWGWLVKTFPSSATYMHLLTGSSLLLIMTLIMPFQNKDIIKNNDVF